MKTYNCEVDIWDTNIGLTPHPFILFFALQVLKFAQSRYSKAYDQYMKSLEYLRPRGDSHDLAWLYNHIGFYWLETGQHSKAERYGKDQTCFFLLILKSAFL